MTRKNSNQVSLFGEAGDDLPEPRLMPVDDWLPSERLGEEFTRRSASTSPATR